jgi:galactose mutarotase-like enzyme
MSPTATRTVGVRPGTFEGVGSVELTAGDLTATFLPGLGMVGVSLRHAGDELLDRRGGIEAYARRGAVMGLPLLHPWANRLSDHGYTVADRTVRLPRDSPLVHCEEHGLPIHGLLAASPHWRVTDAAPEEGRARLRATLDFSRPELLAAFPFPHEIALEAVLAPTALTVATTLRPVADAAVPIAFGFHPFLRLPGEDRTRWSLSLPPRRHLATDERGIPSGTGEPRPAGRTALQDRGYDDGYDRLGEGAEFRVTGGGRAVSVTLRSGYPAAQVFSPPGAQFVCFEPMTAPADALRSGFGLRQVAPGRAFTAVFEIAVGDG